LGTVEIENRYFTRHETPKKRCGTYIRCMSIERMRKSPAADRARFIEPCLPSPVNWHEVQRNRIMVQELG
jgi:hypothetical protein